MNPRKEYEPLPSEAEDYRLSYAELWTTDDDGKTIISEASTLSFNANNCQCGEPVRTKHLTIKLNREAEIVSWEGRCPSCGIKQIIFND